MRPKLCQNLTGHRAAKLRSFIEESCRQGEDSLLVLCADRPDRQQDPVAPLLVAIAEKRDQDRHGRLSPGADCCKSFEDAPANLRIAIFQSAYEYRDTVADLRADQDEDARGFLTSGNL